MITGWTGHSKNSNCKIWRCYSSTNAWVQRISQKAETNKKFWRTCMQVRLTWCHSLSLQSSLNTAFFFCAYCSVESQVW